MTDDEIDAVLLEHFNPDHRAFRNAPIRHVRERLSWLVEQNYIMYMALPQWESGGQLQEPGFRRTPAGNERLARLHMMMSD